MAKRKKPSLKKALQAVDELPTNYFGKVEIDIETLPCVTKPKKEKITANFDADLLEKIRAIAEKYDVSYTSLMNDTLRKIFVKNDKAG